MRAIRVEQFGDPSVLQLQTDVPIPQAGPGQVVVRIHATGVSPFDTAIRSGYFPELATLPYTPGTGGAGVIAEVGEGVTNLRIGDRVCIHWSITGTYAEYTLCNATNVCPLPDILSFEQGVCLSLSTPTAYRSLYIIGEAKAGERVLIHGASGAVGLAAVQLAKSDGLFVVGTAGTDKGIAAVTSAGADVVLNHRSEGYVEELKALGAFDLCLEMIANINLVNDFAVMKPRGRIVIVGSRGPVEINPHEILSKELQIKGMVMFNQTPEEAAACDALVVERVLSGAFRPLVDLTYDLNDAAAAHEEVLAHTQGSAGDIVLRIP